MLEKLESQDRDSGGETTTTQPAAAGKARQDEVLQL
ncbi:unnamed protein product [Linum tenue]|uniref:Uncharacterized protein n=1 Tax=Linum tenue TaxID=586396 RepID=A0AAV0R295_9ROSI|nr:unnamed protein product [Linum tenue]